MKTRLAIFSALILPALAQDDLGSMAYYHSRYKFPCGARAFVEAWNSHGPAHHCAVGSGWQFARLSKVAALLGIRIEKVC